MGPRDTDSLNLATGELNMGVITMQAEGEMKTCAPEPPDDDGTDISLEDWELGSRNPLEIESALLCPLKSLKGISVRTKFTPIEPKVHEDRSPRHFPLPDRFDTSPMAPRTIRGSGARHGSVSLTSLERKSVQKPANSSGEGSSQQLVVDTGSASHHLDNVHNFGSTTSPNTLRIGSNKINLSNSDSNYSSNLPARSDRGMAWHASIELASDIDKDLGTSGRRYRSPPKCRISRPPWNDEIVEHPNWDSPRKNRPHSTATLILQNTLPTLHGTRSRSTADNSAVRERISPLLKPEIVTEHQRNVTLARRGRTSEVRSSLSLQTIAERSRFYDTSSSFTSSSSVPSSLQSRSESTEPTSKPDSPSFLLRCNAKREYNDLRDAEDSVEDMKLGMVCGGSLIDTNVSGDPVRLLSKLCGVPVPLSKQPVTKSCLQHVGHKLDRSNTIAGSWEAQDEEIHENFAILGRHASLKLLSERCYYGPCPPYNVHKVPRKIRDHEPHQHFYKPISKSLDQLLRS